MKVLPTRVTGRIADWKGKFGWIDLDRPIAHPQAKMHKGQVYLSQMDVEAEIEGVGARVSFFVYADGSGLGASDCRPAGGEISVARTVAKPQTAKASSTAGKGGSAWPGKGVSNSTGSKKRLGGPMVTGKVKVWKGTFGWVVPVSPIDHPTYRGQLYVKSTDINGGNALEAGQEVRFHLYEDSQGLGADGVQVVTGGGRGGAVSPKAAVTRQTPPPAGGYAATVGSSNAFRPPKGPPKEPPLSAGPRERITVVPTTGEVLEWKGTHGWIKVHEDVDHPAAAKREGKVLILKKDLGEDRVALKAGDLVQFHVFADNVGIGAEECMPF